MVVVQTAKNQRNYIRSFLSRVHNKFFLYGTRASGKSHTTALLVLLDILQYPHIRWGLCRTTMVDARKSQFKLLLELIDAYRWHKYFMVNRTAGIITSLKTGSYAFICGSEQSSSILSVPITDIWFEEGDQTEYSNYIKIIDSIRSSTAISRHGNRQIFTLNPSSKLSWIYEFFVQVSSKSDWYVEKSSFIDNQFVSESKRLDYLDRSRYTENMYKRYVEGDWVNDDYGLIFNENMLQLGDASSSARGCVFMDAGYTVSGDYTAIIKASADRGNIYIEDIYMGNIDQDTQVNMLHVFYDARHRVLGFDSWGAQIVYRDILNREFRNRGIPYNVHPWQVSIDKIIPIHIRLFNDKRVFFSKKVLDNREFVEQILSFSSKKKNRKDDGVDAMINAIDILTTLEYFRNY